MENSRNDQDQPNDPNDVEEIIEIDDIDEDNDQENLADGLEDVEIIEYDADDDDDDGEDAVMGYDDPDRDDSQITFKSHTGSVFCVATDSESKFAVTGGEDDTAYIWSLDNADIYLKCSGHKDSVVAAGFSHNSKYVASADMSGLIKVWKLSDKKEVWSFECSDIEWMNWHPAADVLFAGTTEGTMWMWKIPSGDCKTYQGPGCSCSCGSIFNEGKQAVTGYEDGKIRIWDLRTSAIVNSFTGKDGHRSSVTCIDCHKDNILIASGSTDCTAKIMNTQKVVCTFSCHNGKEEENSVEAISFSPSHQYLATGTLSGSLSVWDITTQTCRVNCDHEAGIVRLHWDKDIPSIYTCTLDGIVHFWDARSGKREFQWFGHAGEILDFDFTRDGTKLVTSSGDSTAKVFTLAT